MSTHGAGETLSEAECNRLRAMRCPFNDMLRETYRLGRESRAPAGATGIPLVQFAMEAHEPGQAEPGEGGNAHVPLDTDGSPMPRCPECNACHEIVRPGKTQPTCLCEAYHRECDQHAETQRQLDDWRGRCERAEMKLELRDKILEKAEKERDATQADYRTLANLVHRAAEILRTIVTEGTRR